MTSDTIRIDVTEASQVGDARRRAAAITSEIAWSEEDRGRAALIITEAAHNLVRHAQGGEMLLNVLDRCGAPQALEILALDRGPGMSDTERAMTDGVSTYGTSGAGLGAITRLADLFDIYSMPGRGTALLARIEPSGKKKAGSAFEVGAVAVALKGEPACGDEWMSWEQGGRAVFAVVDGLGHGVHASEAARTAQAIFEEKAELSSVTEIMAHVDQGLRATRGAVMAIASANVADENLEYVGIGNISGTVVSGAAGKMMVSLPGTLGHSIRKPQRFPYEWTASGLLIMTSDGIQSQASLSSYPGLGRRHPSLIAATIYRDFSRVRDDATVLVARRSGPQWH